MSQDRFVHWQDQRPAVGQVHLVARSYLGEFAKVMSHDGRRLTITLRGNYSHPLQNIPGAPHKDVHAELARRSRWIEVYVDPEYVDVITRQQDPATNALADGLAAVLVGWWGGRLER